MPKEKLVIGIPAYGRGWTLANPKMDFGIDARAIGPSAVTTMEPGVAAYYEVKFTAQYE